MSAGTFGPLLRAHRKSAGLTLRVLGERIGMALSHLSDVERSTRPPFDAAYIVRAADALGVDVVELLRAAALDIEARKRARGVSP